MARTPTCEVSYQCVTHGFYTNFAEEIAYTSVTLLVSWALPLTIIIGCFVIVAVKMSQEARMVMSKCRLRKRLTSAVV